MTVQQTQQLPWEKIRSVAKADVETALVAATQCTKAYRIANLSDKPGTFQLMKLDQFTNSLFVTLEFTNDSEVNAAITIWGYSETGPAVLIGTVATCAGGAQVTDDGGFWMESSAPADDAQTVTETNVTGRMGYVKFDTTGFRYIYVQVTTITEASGTVNVWARPW